jgi:hypothetical protein
MTLANDLAVRRASEAAGIEFMEENGGGPGVRLKKAQSANINRVIPARAGPDA